jgi:hypothetical protein
MTPRNRLLVDPHDVMILLVYPFIPFVQHLSVRFELLHDW